MTPADPPAADHEPAVHVRLRLYLAGASPNSVIALANLRAALKEHPDRIVDLELIDILADPARGIDDGILVTPMLVKIHPLPERRILGNLRDREMLLGVLEVGGCEVE